MTGQYVRGALVVVGFVILIGGIIGGTAERYRAVEPAWIGGVDRGGVVVHAARG